MGHFLPFYPTIYPKNKIWKKCKNTPGDIILLHICSINEDHMMYGSCNTRHGKQNFLSFWAIFLHLTLLTTQKINIFKKMKKKKKKLWRDYHFTLVYHKWWSYDVWFLRHGAQNTNFLSFSTIFFTSKQPGKSKFWKNGKKRPETSPFFICLPWMTIIWCMVPEIWSVPKIKIICYTTPEIWCVRDVIIIFQFGPFFSL